MTVSGSCHCGVVRIEAPGAPDWVANCNCSLCRRLGWMVAFYPDRESVRISGDTISYLTGSRSVEFRHCPKCGCTTHWESLTEGLTGAGINARMLDGFEMRAGRFLFDGREIEVRHMDNAG